MQRLTCPYGSSVSLAPDSSPGHPAHVSTRFGPRHSVLVCGQLYDNDRIRRGRSLFSLSCRLSAAAIRFLAVLSRHGSPPSSRSAYRWLVNPPDHDGVSMFRTGESRPVSGAPYTPGPWCSHGRHRNFGHHCRLSTAGPVPRCHFPSPELWVTRLAGVHTIRPFRSFPCL
jgi:hypothetical protein